MHSIYLEHAARYPLSEPQDFLKLAYQSEFGGGHLVDPARSLAYLKQELDEMQPADAPVLEDVGGGLCRLHLQSSHCLRPETVNGLFQEACRPRGSLDGMHTKLDILGDTLPDMPGLSAAIAAYRAEGCPMQRHSQRFREVYHPAYRLVPAQTLLFLPLFQKIDALLREMPFVRVAIDGRCASGKSTLAALLSRVYGASLFHMDDYFLPFPRKTPERLAEPGGNVDYERFHQEIASRPKGETVVWRAFDCSEQALGPVQETVPAALTIVEGSYALHPTLADAYDLKVFLTVDPGEQSARILRRNGPEMHRVFRERWIPMEEHYFSALHIREQCSLTFDCTSLRADNVG